MGDHSKWRDALRPYMAFGNTAAVGLLLKRGLEKWIEWNTFVIVTAPIRHDERVAGETVIARDIVRADVPLLARAFDCPAEELAERLDHGDLGFCAFRDGQPVHMRWVATRPTEIPDVSLWFCPGPGDAYVYHYVTHPKARGQRLWDAVRIAMDNRLAQEGFRRKIGYVRADNHRMWSAMRKTPGGVERVGLVRYFRRPGREAVILNRVEAPVYKTPP